MVNGLPTAAHRRGYEAVEDDVFNELKSSLKEAVAYKEGKPNKCKTVTIELDEDDIKLALLGSKDAAKRLTDAVGRSPGRPGGVRT